MKVVKTISDLNDSQICSIMHYSNELRCFGNIHFCLDLNISDHIAFGLLLYIFW